MEKDWTCRYFYKKETLEALRKAIIEFENLDNFIDESNISVSDYWFKEYG